MQQEWRPEGNTSWVFAHGKPCTNLALHSCTVSMGLTLNVFKPLDPNCCCHWSKNEGLHSYISITAVLHFPLTQVWLQSEHAPSDLLRRPWYNTLWSQNSSDYSRHWSRLKCLFNEFALTWGTVSLLPLPWMRKSFNLHSPRNWNWFKYTCMLIILVSLSLADGIFWLSHLYLCHSWNLLFWVNVLSAKI